HWDVRVTYPSGRRTPPIHLDASVDEPSARALALEWTVAAAEGRLVFDGPKPSTSGVAPAAETAETWFARYFQMQEERGHTSVNTNRGRWRKWCSARLGSLAMRAITRDDIEAFVEELDASVRAERLAWKTAVNTWGLVTKGFDEATRSKTRTLRVV